MLYSRTPRLATILGAGAVLVSASPAAAQVDTDKLSIHGFLTQGVARSDDLPIHGIGLKTTADYRNAALQFRYAASSNDAVVLQFAHRRLGESIMTRAESDVALDWAFYQRRMGGFSARAGRIPMPSGIYNETRDVGVLLPFYRAPGNYYMEGIETVDGAQLGYRRDIGPWGVEANGYYGGIGMKMSTQTPTGPMLSESRIDGVLGGQLWLSTPISGLRVGVNGSRFKYEMPGVDGAMIEQQATIKAASVDGNFSRFLTRGEFSEVDLGTMTIRNYYGQTGVKVAYGVSVNAQAEYSFFEMPMGPMTFKQRTTKDLAASVNYAPSSNVVLKFEGHRVEGFSFDQYFAPGAPAGRSTYFIASVSTSF